MVGGDEARGGEGEEVATLESYALHRHRAIDKGERSEKFHSDYASPFLQSLFNHYTAL